MITSKELYNRFVEKDVIKQAQPVTASEAIDRYRQINMIYSEATNLYQATAAGEGLRIDMKAQAKKINDITYDLIEDALIREGYQVLSRGVIRQIGFYTNNEMMKITWLAHVTQSINGVSIKEINDVIYAAVAENAEAYRVSVVTKEDEYVQPDNRLIWFFRNSLRNQDYQSYDSYLAWIH